ncbi:hypothetical protein GP486_008764, partial [Trichoglossum hirsutum]
KNLYGICLTRGERKLLRQMDLLSTSLLRPEQQGEEGGERSVELDCQLAKVIFKFFIKVLTHHHTDGLLVAITTLNHSLAVLGISSSGRHLRTASEFTPTLAGMLYTAKLFFLEFALPSRPYELIGVLGRSDVTDQLKRLQDIRHTHMLMSGYHVMADMINLFLYGKKYTCYGELGGLRVTEALVRGVVRLKKILWLELANACIEFVCIQFVLRTFTNEPI